jgi:hypothetical protein
VKNKRWLFVLLGVLIVINVGVLIVSRFTDYHEWIGIQLINLAENQIDAKFEIATLTVTDRQLTLSDVVIIDNNDIYTISIEQVYVNYNLFKVIFSNLRLFKAVESIAVIRPEIEIDYHREFSDKVEKNDAFLLELPDTSDYFQSLSVREGLLSVRYSDENIWYSDQFSGVHLQINNDETTKGFLRIRKAVNNGDAYIDQQETDSEPVWQVGEVLAVDFEVEAGAILSLDFRFSDYEINDLKIQDVAAINARLSSNGSFGGRDLLVSGELTGLTSEITGQFALSAPLVNFEIEEDYLAVSCDEFNFKGEKGKLFAEINNLFSSTPSLSANVVATGIEISEYFEPVSGLADVNIVVNGHLLNPEAEIAIVSNRLNVLDEKIYNTEVSAYFKEKSFSIELLSADWQENVLQGQGSFGLEDGLRFQIAHEDLVFDRNDFRVSSDLVAEIFYGSEFELNAELENMSIDHDVFAFKDMSLSLSLLEDDIKALIKGNRIEANIDIDLKDSAYFSSIDLKGIDPNQILKSRSDILKSYPHLSGNIDLEFVDKVFSAQTGLRMFNPGFGQLEGRINSGLSYNTGQDSVSFFLETENTTYNREPYHLEIKAAGNTNSISSEKMILNDEIRGDFEISLTSDRHIRLGIAANELELRDYLLYFLTPYTASDYSGKVSLDLNLDYPGDFSGTVVTEDLSYKTLGTFRNEFEFFSTADEDKENASLTNYTLHYNNELQSLDRETVLQFEGTTSLGEDLDTEIYLNTEIILFEQLLPDSQISGKFKAEGLFKREDRANTTELLLDCEDLYYRGLVFNTFQAKIRQEERKLVVEKLNAAGDELILTGGGEIGFNILTNEAFSNDDVLNLNFSGDLLKLFSHSFSFLEEGRSNTEAQFTIGIIEDELSFLSGNLVLSGGNLKVKNQPERIESINIDISTNNNILVISRFEGKVGEGRLYIRNEVNGNAEDEFQLGMLQIGNLYVRTTTSGVNIHVPHYTPPNTIGNVVVRGRGESEALIKGPFDDISIIADLHISNAAVTYPSGTENLFKMINLAADRRTKGEPAAIPLSLDLMLIANQQVRYVTYPLNLLLVPDSFLHLIHDETTYVKDAFFASESGNLDMFGTNFNLDYAELTMNHDLHDYRLRGYFYKYAVDGSLISMNIYNENTGQPESLFDSLNFTLESDNPEDRTMLHVLSKLRYNRRLEDIPRSQQNSLLQDEFLQIAGLGITGALVDPFIYPIESRIRRILKLDFFSIKPGLMENIVRNYGYSERERELSEEHEVIQFGKNILLNNLSINMGKLIARDFYLDYEFLLQKPADVVGSSDLLVYHNFTLFYNLPYKLRLAYSFYLKPEDENNSHEIFVRRSFSFW